MALSTYKPLLLYGAALTVLGIIASAFQSTDLIRVCIVAYAIGWVVFLFVAGKGR